MIQVNIDMAESSKGRIEAKGHAQDKYVCNTVSTLMWALSLCLETASAWRLNTAEADGYTITECELDPNTYPIFEGFVACFQTLSEQFPNEIKIACLKG